MLTRMPKGSSRRETLTVEGEMIYSLVGRVIDDLERTPRTYRFTSNEEFAILLERSVRDAMRIYWREILFRTHLAAATSLIRFRQWVAGAIQASEDKNLMALAACYRGLIESSADTRDGLGAAAVTLAERRGIVERALRGELAQRVTSAELEDSLIHFQFARKVPRGEDVPSSHQAKRITDYLAPLARTQPRLQDMYSQLCDITHPGASSILAFTHQHPDQTLDLSFATEKQKSAELTKAMSPLLMDLIYMSANPGLLMLRVLNAFPELCLHTAALEHFRFSTIPAGRRIEKILRG